MAPLTIGLLLATGWVLLRPSGGHPGALALAGATVVLMLRTKISPVIADIRFLAKAFVNYVLP